MTVAVAVVALAAAGCGSGGGSSSGGKPDLVVSAAASLKDAFTQYAQQFPDATVRSSFAGSNEVHPSIVWAKFKSLVEGSRLASERLWKK